MDKDELEIMLEYNMKQMIFNMRLRLRERTGWVFIFHSHSYGNKS